MIIIFFITTALLCEVRCRTFLDLSNHLLVTTIPKCGCTTVEKHFMNFLWGTAKAATLKVHEDISLVEVNGKLAQQAIQQGFQAFVFPRHPFSRTVSFFSDKIFHRRGITVRCVKFRYCAQNFVIKRRRRRRKNFVISTLSE